MKSALGVGSLVLSSPPSSPFPLSPGPFSGPVGLHCKSSLRKRMDRSLEGASGKNMEDNCIAQGGVK